MVRTGLSLTLQINQKQEISQKQEIQHKLLLTQRLSIKLYLEMTDFFEGLYKNAKKERYAQHGLDFEFAVIKKKDLPKKALEFGPGFAVFKCDPFTGEATGTSFRFVVTDYLPDFPKKFQNIVAVHEYGESLAIGHKEASLLEWGTAQKEGILNEYLVWMSENFPCKLADLEYSSKIYDIMPEEVCVSVKAIAEHSDEARVALELIKYFDFPPSAKKLSESYGALANEISTGLSKAGNEAEYIMQSQMPDRIFIAAYIFHKVATELVTAELNKLIPMNNNVEETWKRAIGQVSKIYDEQRLSTQHALSESVMKGKADKDVFENLDFANIPFGFFLPIQLSFAMETIKLLQEKDKKKIGTPEEFLNSNLKLATMLARCKLRIVEEEQMATNAPRLAFYIKSVIFDAVAAIIESGQGSILQDVNINKRFEKEIQKIEEIFVYHTDKKLFQKSETKLWYNIQNITALYKECFSLKADDTKVVKFSGRNAGITKESMIGRRFAFSGT